MLFAAVDPIVWQALIAAALTVYLDWSRRRFEKRVDATTVKVDEVKDTLQTSKTETVAKIDGLAAKAATKEELAKNTALTTDTAKAVEVVAKAVEVVHDQGNSAKEKQEQLLADALAKIESLTAAIGILQGREQGRQNGGK